MRAAPRNRHGKPAKVKTMDLAEFRHMTFHAGPVRSAGRLMLYTIIPISPVNDDHIELRPPYLTSVPMIMSHTGIKTARTVPGAGWYG
jgi:hypothetical protein